jgi:hypothetical protein
MRFGRLAVAAVVAGVLALACTQDFGVFEGAPAVDVVDGAPPSAEASTTEDSSTPPADAATDVTADVDAGPCTTAPANCLTQRTTCRTACDTTYTTCEDACPNGSGGFNCRLTCFNTRTTCRTNCNNACVTCGGACTGGCT